MTDEYRAVHPSRGPAEYSLTVYCVGRVKARDLEHDEQLVDVLGYWPTPTSPDKVTIGYLNWQAARGSLQTPFGEQLAAEHRSGRRVDLGGWGGTPRGMHYATRWRFECPECEATVPGSGKKMDVILGVLRGNNVPRISLAALSARL